MLQSIVQYGSGPPTYIYSPNEVTASNSFFHVFAAEMSGYDSKRQEAEAHYNYQQKPKVRESEEKLLEYYQREFKVRGINSWKK